MTIIRDRNPDDALKVFISYSRAQVHFADELELALSRWGYTVLIDRHSIAKGEDFQDRLGQMILNCDTVVFVLSDDSAQSDICAWEVEEARRLTKRILVITIADLSDGVSCPPHLAGIDWIHAWRNPKIPGSSQTKGFIELDTALNTDVDWLRDKTVLQEQAERWAQRAPDSTVDEFGDNASSLLLRGNVLQEAMAWLQRKPKSETLPAVITDFLDASEQAEANRAAAAAANLKERERMLRQAEDALSAKRETEAQLEEARAQEAERAAKDAARIRRTGVVGAGVAGVFLIGSVIAGWWGFENRRDAQVLGNQLEVREVALQVQSSDILARQSAAMFSRESGDHSLSMLMALQADPAAQRNELRQTATEGAGFKQAQAQLQVSLVHNDLSRIFNGEDDTFKSIAFSPDGQHLAVGAWDGVIHIWDRDTGTEIKTIEAYTTAVLTLVYSPDGTQLASGSYGDGASLWDVETGELQRTLGEAGYGDVWSLSYSPDGTQIASAGDEDVYLWDTTTGEELMALSGHGFGLRAVEFSTDGTRLASGGRDGQIRVWDMQTGSEIVVIEANDSAVLTVSLSPDGQYVASGAEDDSVTLWSAQSGDVITVLEDHQGDVWSLDFSPDGRYLASGSFDESIKIWDLNTFELTSSFEGHGFIVWAATFSPDGQYVASGSADNTVRLWKLRPDAAEKRMQGELYSGNVAFSPDGVQLAGTNGQNETVLWDVGSGEIKQTFSSGNTLEGSFGFSADGTRLASSDWNAILVVDVNSDELIAEIEPFDMSPYLIAYSPDGKRVAGTEQGTFIRVWDVETTQQMAEFKGHENSVLSMSFFPDSQRVASSSEDRTVRIWNVETGEELALLEGHQGAIEAVAVSPDGQQVASGSTDNTVRLWNPESKLSTTMLIGHSDDISLITYAPSGRQVATAARDKTVRIWDTETGVQITKLAGYDNDIKAMAFSADGRDFYTVTTDDRVFVWQVPDALHQTPEALVQSACEVLVNAGAKMAFDADDIAAYSVLESELSYPDLIRFAPNVAILRPGLASPCRGLVDGAPT
nr:TIR domain-containing protein [Hyphomonas sp. Mor2]